MSSPGEFFVRWRVRLGYPLAIGVLLFAQPQPFSILAGGLVGALGLLLRAYAAGVLHKQEVLTVCGPYAYTRNPLYLGSSILALGTGIAARSWIGSLLLLLYFSVFYSVVMRREERELRLRHAEAFDRFAAAVPLFLPRFRPARFEGAQPAQGSGGAGPAGAFSMAQYRKNHEWQALIGFVLLLAVLYARWWIWLR